MSHSLAGWSCTRSVYSHALAGGSCTTYVSERPLTATSSTRFRFPRPFGCGPGRRNQQTDETTKRPTSPKGPHQKRDRRPPGLSRKVIPTDARPSYRHARLSYRWANPRHGRSRQSYRRLKAIDTLGLVLTTVGSHFLYGSSLGRRALESVGVILAGVLVMCFSNAEMRWWNKVGASTKKLLCKEIGMCKSAGFDYRVIDAIMGWSQ